MDQKEVYERKHVESISDSDTMYSDNDSDIDQSIAVQNTAI